jgi:2-polyprenyl-6-methoxyphenol hydroxylase-like FAD-dependent oxidoreductase
MRGDGVRVLIVGAGIAGLAAARTLRALGAAVDVVERAPAPSIEGTGIFLPGNAVRALNTLGLDAEVSARAVRIERQRIADHRGQLLLDLDVEQLWGGVGRCLALHRADLHQVLLAGAAGVAVRWGCTPQAIDADDRGVTVRLSDATTGRYALVLGADGLHSAVRRMLFAAAPARPVGQYAHRFVVAAPDPAPVWTARLGPGSSFLTIPIGQGKLYCYSDGPPGQPPPPLRELLAHYAPPVPALLDALEEATADTVHAGPIEEVVLDSWSRGAVLLIGDAAHATSPNMAQGAAMALEDAIVLAECLTSAGSITDALTAYERRRRPRTDWVLRQTHRRDRTRTLTPAVRNLVIKRLGRRIFQANYRPLRQSP